MVRRNVYLTEEQLRFLEDLNVITVSEHIRRALDEYIENKKKEVLSSSSSSKKEVTNG